MNLMMSLSVLANLGDSVKFRGPSNYVVAAAHFNSQHLLRRAASRRSHFQDAGADEGRLGWRCMLDALGCSSWWLHISICLRCVPRIYVAKADRQRMPRSTIISSPNVAVLARKKGCIAVFSARCNIYISRLCYDVSVRLSVCDGSALAHYS